MAEHWATIMDVGALFALFVSIFLVAPQVIGWYVERIGCVELPDDADYEPQYISLVPMEIAGYRVRLLDAAQASGRPMYPRIRGGLPAPTQA